LSDFAESYGDSFEEDTDCEVDDSEVGVEVGEDFAVEEVDEVLLVAGATVLVVEFVGFGGYL
jgi:hypothetical protein